MASISLVSLLVTWVVVGIGAYFIIPSEDFLGNILMFVGGVCFIVLLVVVAGLLANNAIERFYWGAGIGVISGLIINFLVTLVFYRGKMRRWF